jgi:RNA polymerase sigma-70 factor (ECF subfamily)
MTDPGLRFATRSPLRAGCKDQGESRRNRRRARGVCPAMLDSPRLDSASIAVRRDPPTVEDLRSTTVPDDPVQRRDLILIERARAGDLDAFNDLVRLYQDSLFALVVRMVPDRDQASDAVQEAFFSAFRNLASFRGGSVKSWLNRICVNAAMDTQRARKRRPSQPYPELEDEAWQPPAGEEADPERIAVHAERSRLLGEAMTHITDDQRTAIVLYDVEGYDYGEIADMTGVSLGTVKSRIHRGRLALRGLLEDRMDVFRG